MLFKHPAVVQVIETLNQGRPASAADLQALVDSHLHALSVRNYEMDQLMDGKVCGT